MPATLETVRWPVRTERLTIRAAVLADAGATWQFRRLDSVTDWLPGAPTSRTEYEQQFRDRVLLGRTLVIERAGLVIGDLLVSIEDAWAQDEVAAEAKGVQAERTACRSRGRAGNRATPCGIPRSAPNPIADRQSADGTTQATVAYAASTAQRGVPATTLIRSSLRNQPAVPVD